MDFAELRDRVLADAFPNGPPENLIDSINQYVVSGMIEVQRWVKCFQVRHDDVHRACNTFWHCGASVISAPRGKILRVYTIENDDWCNPVVLTPVSLAESRRWQAKFRLDWKANYYKAPDSGAGLPMGFDVPNANSDAISGRALTGVYALDDTAKRLYIVPWIQSNESIVVEWQGIKRQWQDADLVPDDPDFIRLIRLFVELEFGRKWGCADLGIRDAQWREALADAMWTCQQESRLWGERPTQEENELAWRRSMFTSDPVEVVETDEDPEGETEIALVGNFGVVNEHSAAVAELITNDLTTGYVVGVGNVKQEPNVSAAQGLAPYSGFVDEGRMKVALGNLDVDGALKGADVVTHVGNPGNQRYFHYKVGPVSIFVLNSGLDSSGNSVEPDGNFNGSVQHNTMLAAIIRDTSPWKIAVIHHPPYSSGEDTFPGESVVRWVTDLPVHAVVSAHANVYERLTVRNRPHFIVGTGGMELDGFNSTPYPGSITRISDFGYLKLTATCNDARFEFIDKDGEVRDTLILDRAVPVTPSSPLMDPVITDHPDSAVVNFGDDYQLSVTASGTEPLFYQWQLDGVDIEGANSSTYTANDIEEVRRYRVRVWNHVGAVVSAEALVLPFIQPTAQYIAIPGWGALKERTLHSPNEVVTLSFVDAKDDYGAGRKYIFDPNAMADEDKPNVAIPNDIDPSHPGRWLWLTPWAAYKATDIKTYATLSDFRSESVGSPVVFIIADGEGHPAHFERNGNANGEDDGVNEIINAAGIHYTRLNGGPVEYIDFKVGEQIVRLSLTQIPDKNEYTIHIVQQ